MYMVKKMRKEGTTLPESWSTKQWTKTHVSETNIGKMRTARSFLAAARAHINFTILLYIFYLFVHVSYFIKIMGLLQYYI